jgi:molecular chaperone GrpE (heat shock protein)
MNGAGDDADHEPADEAGLLGAADIVAAFTALRHELKLQVRAGRDFAERLDRLETAVVAAARQPPPVAGDAVRDLAVAIAEIEESLERATVAVAEQAESVSLEAVAVGAAGAADEHGEADDDEDDEDAARGSSEDALSADEAAVDPRAAWDDCLARAPWHVRAVAAGLVARLRDVFDEAVEQATEDGRRRTAAAEDSLAGAVTALADAGQGLELLLARTRRLMAQAGVQRIDVLSEPFDAGRMRAVDVVEDADVPEGHVAEQYRPGYLLHGTVLRPAEVQVAR